MLESFPIGRRLAFDTEKGRLWVVCPRCERWNLSPLEERWEILEQAERLFRATPRRLSTNQIGLVRLTDATELIRIGKPLRPEYAAWRYGVQLGRRRRQELGLIGGAIASAGTIAVLPAAIGFPVAGLGMGLGVLAYTKMRTFNVPLIRLNTERYGLIAIRQKDLSHIKLLKGETSPFAVKLGLDAGGARFDGREAHGVAARLMPLVNRYGASSTVTDRAARAVETAGSAESYLARVSQYAEDSTAESRGWHPTRRGGLFGLPVADRLAFEMALHEEAEDRALRGELLELERAWAVAEEVAAISDDLLVPQDMPDRLDRMRGS